MESNLINEIEVYKNNYSNNKIVDMSKYINNEYQELFEMIDVKIEKRVYTEEEYDILKIEALGNASIMLSKDESEKIINLFSRISEDCKNYL